MVEACVSFLITTDSIHINILSETCNNVTARISDVYQAESDMEMLLGRPSKTVTLLGTKTQCSDLYVDEAAYFDSNDFI